MGSGRCSTPPRLRRRAAPDANTAASRVRRRRLASHSPSRLPSARRHEAGDTTSRLARGNGSGDLFDVLSAAAETFLANHSATVAARAAAGGHAPAVTPATPARSMLGRPTASQSIPSFPPQVSLFILPGRPAFRLLVACGCPFGWDTPDMPDVVVCPKHGSTRVASGSSSETWSGGPLKLAVLAELGPAESCS